MFGCVGRHIQTFVTYSLLRNPTKRKVTSSALQNLARMASSGSPPGIKRPQFGTRYLTDPNDTFQHNAWDNIEWNDQQEKEADEKVAKNSADRVPVDKCEAFERDAANHWDSFYDLHQNRFFKDRHWLFTEFPELAGDSSVKTNIFEIGCGAGNTVFPVLEMKKPSLFVYCCDFSSSAVNIVQNNTEYDPQRCRAFVCDISTEKWDFPFESESIDIAVMIFVLSAIHPKKMGQAVKNIFKCVKPGGLVVFRDYGRHDMAQLRFKNGRCLSDNFYVRGDGTRVYFFTKDEIHQLFTSQGFVEEQNLVDRRLQVNRGKQLKMYRVWIQSKFRKPVS